MQARGTNRPSLAPRQLAPSQGGGTPTPDTYREGNESRQVALGQKAPEPADTLNGGQVSGCQARDLKPW
jgi:hypothetical protein